MSTPRTDMHRRQEFVWLYRLGAGVRGRARLLGMSTRTEREYRLVVVAAGLLEGAVDDPPDLSLLRPAVEEARPPAAPRAVPSSVEPWLPAIRKSVKYGAGAHAIWDRLKRKDPEFTVYGQRLGGDRPW